MAAGEDGAGREQMTEYDRAAWEGCLKLLQAPTRRKVLPAAVRNRASELTSRAAGRLEDMPAAEAAREYAERAFEGALALTFQPALRSVRPENVVRRFTRKHPAVQALEDVRQLTLRDCDAMLPPRFGYTAAAAGQGAATALAVTGTEVAATVTAGTTAAVAIGAITADTIASMAVMGRTIGVVASRYGYDVRLPEEELFAMGVLSLGSARSLKAKAQALAALSRLAQQMMRRATWDQLRKHVMVKAIERVYTMLGLRLTKRKLAQAVPVVGVGLNAAMSAELADQTFKRAQAVYRLRFLSEKYGIDPREWVTGVGETASGGQQDEVVVDVVAVLEQERTLSEHDGLDDQTGSEAGR